MRLKEALQGKLSGKELLVLRGFDIIGDIAIIEIPRELEKKQRRIAQTILALHKNIRVVARKKGGHTGKYRQQPLHVIAGGQRKTTVHKEHGLQFALNAETCYFSPRLGTERLRIARQVRKGENVLVLFSGVAPYVLVIAKHSPARVVYGIEANPAAHKYAVENAARNKLSHKVVLIKGDAAKIRLPLRFDRVVMPYPKEGYRFLGSALKHVKKNGTLHFYDFQQEGAFANAAGRVREACRAAKKKCRVLRIAECGQVGVRNYRVCVDARIL